MSGRAAVPEGGQHFLDVVDRFAQTSSSLKYQAQHNTTAPGPFTSALLLTRSSTDVLREADETERGLFTLGASAPGTVGRGSGKEIVRKEAGNVTPLRKLRDAPLGGGVDVRGGEPDEYLRAAMRLVDEYKSMPRARTHILSLLEKSKEIKDRIEELDETLQKSQSSTSLDPESSKQQQPIVSFKDEEKKVREIEAKVAAARKKRDTLRRQLQSHSPSTSTSTSKSKSPPITSPSETTTSASPSPVIQPQPKPRTTKISSSKALQERRRLREAKETANQGKWNPFAPKSQTQSKGKEKEKDPEEEAFWSGDKPATRPSKPKPSKFVDSETETPTEFDTSRDSVTDTSTTTTTPSPLLRRSHSRTELLFGTPLVAMKGGSGDVGEEEAEEGQVEADTTVVLTRGAGTKTPTPPLPSVKVVEPTPVKTPDNHASAPEVTPTPAVPPIETRRPSLEFTSDLEDVISKIWITVGDVILPNHAYDVGLGKGLYKPPRAEETFILLKTLTTSPSASIPSLIAHHPTTGAIPLPTPLQILTAHLLLSLLQSPATPRYTLPMNKLKEILGVVVKENGWEGGLEVRVIYGCVGKRLILINRKGGAGGVVEFAK